jgi:hypothetical protein
MITTSPNYNETGKSLLFCAILARSETGKMMESTLFQRQMALVARELAYLLLVW